MIEPGNYCLCNRGIFAVWCWYTMLCAFLESGRGAGEESPWETLMFAASLMSHKVNSK